MRSRLRKARKGVPAVNLRTGDINNGQHGSLIGCTFSRVSNAPVCPKILVMCTVLCFFCGIVAKSENSGVICSVLTIALRIICQDHAYQRIDISGVRSDNGAAAMLAASKLSPGSLCGCFAHEVFKAERRNKSWTTPFTLLEVVWNTDVAVRSSALCDHADTFAKENNTWMHIAYRCPTLANFRCFEGLLADFADEVGCPAAALHLRVKFGPSRLPFYAAAGGLLGFAAHQNAVENLHALLQTHVTGKGPHTHGTFLKSLESNVPQSYRFQRHFPNGPRATQITGMQFLPAMRNTAVEFYSKGGRPQPFDVGSSTVWMFSSTGMPRHEVTVKRGRAKSQWSWTADPPAKFVLQELSLLQ